MISESASQKLDKIYNSKRASDTHFSYRLRRRTDEVVRAICRNSTLNINKILDIGAADGIMLGKIKEKFTQAECVGIEPSLELISGNTNNGIKIILGDAHSLPFLDNSFDAVVSSAVIEHLEQPEKMLKEAYRVLKKDGILIITTAVPFFEKIARIIGYILNENLLKGEWHHTMFNMKKLKKYLREADFQVIQAQKFLMSPVGFPKEQKIEEIIRILKLDFVLLNQLIVGKK